MNIRQKIDNHIDRCEEKEDIGTVRQICLSENDWTEFQEVHGAGIVRMKDAEFYRGIRIHAVNRDRSYIIIELSEETQP